MASPPSEILKELSEADSPARFDSQEQGTPNDGFRFSKRCLATKNLSRSRCESREPQSCMPWGALVASYETMGGPRTQQNDRPHIQGLLSSDCANVISSIGGNPRCKEKTSRLICNHLSQLERYMAITYCSAPMNLIDVGTKHQGDVSILRRFIFEGVFAFGLLSRCE